jgi:hypothetical protein
LVPTAHIEREEALKEADGAVERWIETLRENADTIDTEHAKAFVDTTRRLSFRLHRELEPVLDAESLAEISGIILEGMEALYETFADAPPLVILDDLVVRAERIRHIVRDSLDASLECDEDDTSALVTRLITWLPGIRQPELGKLAGRSVRQLQRWAKEGKRPTRRLLLVVQLIALLRRAWTPEGVVAWFYRPRTDLDGRRPIDVLDNPDYERALRAAVRRGRAQHGS